MTKKKEIPHAAINRKLTLADLEVGDIFAFEGEVHYHIKIENLEGFDKGYVKVFSLYDSKVEKYNLDASVDFYAGELFFRRKF